MNRTHSSEVNFDLVMYIAMGLHTGQGIYLDVWGYDGEFCSSSSNRRKLLQTLMVAMAADYTLMEVLYQFTVFTVLTRTGDYVYRVGWGTT